MTSLTLRKSTDVDDFDPPPVPFGEAIRRHVARGVLSAALQSPLRLGWVAAVSVKAKPFGRAARGLDPALRLGASLAICVSKS